MTRRKSISDEDILERALPIMARAGPAGFTLADIAAEIGLSPATLLQRFGDKKTLVERAFAQDNERFARWIADLPEGRGEAATLAVYRAATEGFHADPDPELADHLLWLREDIRDPVFNALARARFALFRAAILARLPPLRLPPEEVARLLDAQLHGAPIQWAIEPSGSLTDYVMQSLTTVLRLAAD
ncbi:TetR/AcrR family transcriptional regulator [Sphingomonas oligophenolica]|uniref:TetR/AcrR family transcriptional regulator n=1 Tax=Sphingomonas oligophenolica TaxID=301154 RepID=A0ABU9YBW1_9SPHN